MPKTKVSFVSFVIKNFGFSLNVTLSNYSATVSARAFLLLPEAIRPQQR
jgi:hypothetical protein